jgi:phenylalanyl-tRNA synthetase alpha chain
MEELKNNLLEKISLCTSIGEFQKVSSEVKKFIKEQGFKISKLQNIEEKKEFGKKINNINLELESALGAKKSEINLAKFVKSYVDTTIFKNEVKLGTQHPLIALYKKIEKIFVSMGFSVVSGPEIELDKYNFEKLNMPPYHPARDMQDTFYVRQPEVLLRSHTSSVQIRTMEKSEPPIAIVSPGTVYRVDDIDPQHTPMFYQAEGLMVGEGISFANLKAILIRLLKEIFGEETDVRFRPSYYPYTEPSAAVDMSCSKCCKKGCRICGGAGWITVLGSGMVHPAVLQGVGYDSEKYTGFAFGLGLNRLALIYYDLGEIKKLYENDVNLWRQLN